MKTHPAPISTKNNALQAQIDTEIRPTTDTRTRHQIRLRTNKNT